MERGATWASMATCGRPVKAICHCDWGERVRFSAWIKTDGVEGDAAGSGIFVVQSTSEGDEFYQMGDADVAGWTTDWEYREVVLAVEPEGHWPDRANSSRAPP